MESKEIFESINNIFLEVFDDENIELTRESSSNDIEDWDSLNHIQLIVAIEKFFKLRLTILEIESWKNVGEMCDAIELKLNQ